MKLLERYATATGLPIGRQWVLESFYPLPIAKYITLHASSGMLAKNYPYYEDVVELLSHILNTQGIQIVQLGGKDDPPIKGCINLLGQTSYHQSCYILKNSLLHFGNDSWTAHRAGELQLPLVELFGPTSVPNHSPYRFNPYKTTFLESHRWGKNPTFAAQEGPATIAVIPPEQVANEVLKHLGIQHTFTHQTRFNGLLCKTLVFDLVPNTVPSPTFAPDHALNVRMDVKHNEDILAQVLSTGRKINLLVSKGVDLNLLSHFRAQILSYTHELIPADEPSLPSPDYITTLRSILPKSTFFTREGDEKRLADLRFRYLDLCEVQIVKDPTRDDYIGAALTYLNRVDTPENRLYLNREVNHDGGSLQFRTSRFILSDGLIFISYPHMVANQSITTLAEHTGKVIDDPSFWKDSNHYAFTFQPNAPETNANHP
jgi:hypothetical protein